MRRFCLLLLMFVLPLQMSWAAVHACGGEIAAVTATATTAAHGVDQFSHDHDKQSTQSKHSKQNQGTESLADACCTAHSCHNLHNLLAQAAPAVFAIPSHSLVMAPDKRLTQRQFVKRHERPKWLSA